MLPIRRLQNLGLGELRLLVNPIADLTVQWYHLSRSEFHMNRLAGSLSYGAFGRQY